MSSPLTTLLDALEAGDPPPFEWAVAYLDRGSIKPAWRAEAASAAPNVGAMLALLDRDGRGDALHRLARQLFRCATRTQYWQYDSWCDVLQAAEGERRRLLLASISKLATEVIGAEAVATTVARIEPPTFAALCAQFATETR